MIKRSYMKDNSLMPIEDTQAEILAQPIVVAEVLRKCSAVVRALAIDLVRRRMRELLIIGSGDSWFAGLACRLAFERYAGLPTEALQAFEYAAYGRPHSSGQTVAIVISSSGRPTTTWDALDRVLATPAYAVGITDNPYPGNPFSERVHTALIPGASKIGWPTQTTTATIAILLDLAIEIGRGSQTLSTTEADIVSNQLRAIPGLMQNFIDDHSAVIKVIAANMLKSGVRRTYTFVGAGPSLGVAHNGMALLAEGPQEVGIAIAVEEFHHGLHIATIGSEDVVIVIAPHGAADQRYHDTAKSVRAQGAKLIVVVDNDTKYISAFADYTIILPQMPEALTPLLALLPLQLLSLELATQKVAAGYKRPSKVP